MKTLKVGLMATATLIAAALWPIYIAMIAFTRIGLAHWGRHLAILFIWNFVGLMFAVVAFQGL